MPNKTGLTAEQDLRVRRRAARAAISAMKRLKETVPQQLQDFADGKVDDPGLASPPGWTAVTPEMTAQQRAATREMNVRRAAAKVAISATRRLKEPVPQQLQDFADGKVDDPGPL